MSDVKETVDSTVGAGTSDKVTGKINEVVGTVKDKVGEVTGDKKLEAEGEVQHAEGKGEQILGNLKGSFEDVAEKAKHIAENAKEKAGAVVEAGGGGDGVGHEGTIIALAARVTRARVILDTRPLPSRPPPPHFGPRTTDPRRIARRGRCPPSFQARPGV